MPSLNQNYIDHLTQRTKSTLDSFTHDISFYQATQSAKSMMKETEEEVKSFAKGISNKVSQTTKGISFRADPKKNYILENLLYLERLLLPISQTFKKNLSSPWSKYIVGSIFVLFLWIPILLISFTFLPLVLFSTFLFYSTFLNLRILKIHLDDTVSYYTGFTSNELMMVFYDLSRHAVDQFLRMIAQFSSANTPMVIKRASQRIIVFSVQLLILFLENMIHFIRYLQKSLNVQ